MKFGVLALDYDGTIARDGVLDPDVKAAISEVVVFDAFCYQHLLMPLRF